MKIQKNEAILIRALNQSPRPDNFLTELSHAARAENDQRSGLAFLTDLIVSINQNRDPNYPIKISLQKWIAPFDFKRDDSWTNQTTPNTQSRRIHIYNLLKLNIEYQQILDKHAPVYCVSNPIIDVKHEKWYTTERKASCDHYSLSFINNLRKQGWQPENIGLLEQATDDIIGRIADPNWGSGKNLNDIKFAGRGLVVGYVQSGKTTTINLAIAKAIDTGYRLIIILSGLTDLLRKQTQRRLDKDVVGKEFLKKDPEVQEANGYLYMPDWNDFIEHPDPRPGVFPREIERLTTLTFDFSSARGAAKFSDSWVNSESSSKVIVIKKNKSRLINLLKEIKRLNDTSKEILSVLIIDDESDQASINTVNPSKVNAHDPEENKRAAINLAIVQLLKQLPRAQYVGVTATPVSNCFIDPSNAIDLYPRHFILPLSRPPGYMGISNFHDLDGDLDPIIAPEPQPNKKLHIRDINSIRNSDSSELQMAMDAFVLAGALKLFRNKSGICSNCKHHTFFYSDSVRKSDQANSKIRLVNLWNDSAYNSVKGMNRLELLYENDILVNSPYRNTPKYFPTSFSKLKEFISQAIQLIDAFSDGHNCVLVVNSDPDAATIDFNVFGIWKFIVGGAKLSRGYTIEGLTITYFRRKSLNGAALMQMGRWFGYRAGYQDLVRLWISRAEAARPNPFDIYDAYQSICIDEERLRRNFQIWYEDEQEDGTKITPIQVRPLIELDNPLLKPVAKNHMWNAELVNKGFSGVHENTRYSLTKLHLLHNQRLFVNLFKKFPLKPEKIFKDRAILYSIVSRDEIFNILQKFSRPYLNDKDKETDKLFKVYLNSSGASLSDWVVILPQVNSDKQLSEWDPGLGWSAKTVYRGWKPNFNNMRLNTIGDKLDRIAAHEIAHVSQAGSATDKQVAGLSNFVQKLKSVSSRGVILLYPTYAAGHKQTLPPIMAFECILPPTQQKLAWRVRDKVNYSPIILNKK